MVIFKRIVGIHTPKSPDRANVAGGSRNEIDVRALPVFARPRGLRPGRHACLGTQHISALAHIERRRISRDSF